MNETRNIFAIIGSASSNSANEKLINIFAALTTEFFDVTVFNDLKLLPHFDPQLSADSPPTEIIAFRNQIENADGVIICTPEYIFSIPSGLKNAIEWCVATTVFNDKPTGLITASLGGQKAHEELQLIMRTVTAKFTAETTLLIQGIKGKLNEAGLLTDEKTKQLLQNFIEAFKQML